MEHSFEIAGQTVTVHQPYNTTVSLNTIVYLQSVQGNGQSVLQECMGLECPPFTLVSLEVPDWNDRLTPWECNGLFAEDAPFEGHAKDQLCVLEEVVEAVESYLGATPHNRVIAGYSLAGLFAVWVPFNASLFNAVASASGSLWYPGFAEYAAEKSFIRKPECAYFSLGSKEAKTPSRLLRNVAKGTSSVVEAFKEKGVKTTFESNPGNHFKEPDLRMAKGICWVLDNL